MKTNDALGTVVGTSHRRIARVDLYDSTHTLVQADLPVVRGTVTASAVDEDRWTASIELAGDLWAPVLPTDPLSGLSRHYLRIYMGAEVNTDERWVEVCRVIPATARTRRSVESVTVDLDCIGLGGYLALASSGRYLPLVDETCQDMIARIVTDAAPPAWGGVVLDSTTPVPVPVGYYGTEEQDVRAVMQDLAAIANVATFFDCLGRLVIRDPLPTTWGPAEETITVGEDLASYDTEMGRDFGFANRVEVTFQPVGAGRGSFRADWQYAVQTGAPAAGQIRTTDNGSSKQWRVHKFDKEGYDRSIEVEKVERGDLLQARTTTGEKALVEVVERVDLGTYVALDVVVIQESTSSIQNNVTVELTAWARLVDDVIGTAEWDTAPLDPASSDLVTYQETRLGVVTQAQADARAAALLQATITAWSTTIVQAIPDPRLEPDDDITVVLPDRTLDARITRVELPLAPTDLMTVGVRTFPGGV